MPDDYPAISATNPNREDWVYNLENEEYVYDVIEENHSRGEIIEYMKEIKKKHKDDKTLGRYMYEFSGVGPSYKSLIENFGTWAEAKRAAFGVEKESRIYNSIIKGVDDISWPKFASEVRGDECEMCGDDGSSQDEKLHVHHIIPVMWGGVSNEDLVITLCKYCHQPAESYAKEIIDNPYQDWTDEEMPKGRERWTPDKGRSEVLETKSILEYTNDD